MYLLDATALIELARRDLGGAGEILEWIGDPSRTTRVHSVEAVRAEIIENGRDGDLAGWAIVHKHVFLRPDKVIVDSVGEVCAVVEHRYRPSAVAGFLKGSDLMLVAHALAASAVVVTCDVDATTEWKLTVPEACRALGVSCVATTEMLRREEPGLLRD